MITSSTSTICHQVNNNIFVVHCDDIFERIAALHFHTQGWYYI